MTPPPTAQRVGDVVLLTGTAVSTTLRAILTQIRVRQRNGLPTSGELAQIREVLMSVAGHSDLGETPSGASSVAPDVGIEEAAKMLGTSERHARRLAPRLGGKRIGGRWLLDRDAIIEHTKG